MNDSFDLEFTPVDELDTNRLDALADVLGKPRGTPPGYLLDRAIVLLRDRKAAVDALARIADIAWAASS